MKNLSYTGNWRLDKKFKMDLSITKNSADVLNSSAMWLELSDESKYKIKLFNLQGKKRPGRFNRKPDRCKDERYFGGGGHRGQNSRASGGY